ncbi:hypothetical protein PVAG01_00264 [Phlyctema vagabunda]|uniref:Uncharacterized protein n=1 Tax=Phlyctema vagabunda TaxID=108571 RepID=A0ABR4PU39_9HELO
MDTSDATTPSAGPARENNLDFPMMYTSGYKRLMAVDIKGIKRPRYKDKDLWWIINILGYTGYARGVDQCNPGRAVDRRQMDALWVVTLRGRYRWWNCDNVVEQTDVRLSREKHAQAKLRDGFDQRRSAKTEEYWAKKVAMHPGLDDTCPPDDSDEDHHPDQIYVDGYLSDYPSSFEDDETNPNIDEMAEEIGEMDIGDGQDVTGDAEIAEDADAMDLS